MQMAAIYTGAASSVVDERSQARVIAGIARIEQGNFGDRRNLGGGLRERRFLGRGAGPRLYYSLIGEDLTLLLVTGDKTSAREQQADIDLASEVSQRMDNKSRVTAMDSWILTAREAVRKPRGSGRTTAGSHNHVGQWRIRCHSPDFRRCSPGTDA